MNLTQILQKLRSYLYTKKEIDSMGGGTSLSSTLNSKANDSDVVHKTGNETVAGNKTFSNSPTVTRPNVGTLGYNVKLAFKRGEEISATNHSTFRVVDADNEIVSEVCTENYSDGKVAQILNVRNTNDEGEQVQSNISHLIDKNAEQDIFFSTRNGKTSLGASTYKWKDVQTYFLNGKTPAYADDLSSYVLDSDAVHKTGNETITGIKTFVGNPVIKSTTIDKSITPASNEFKNLYFNDKNGDTLSTLYFAKRANGNHEFNLQVLNRDESKQPLNLNLVCTQSNERNIVCQSDNVLPVTNNTVNLGLSSNKWKDVYATTFHGDVDFPITEAEVNEILGID